MGKNENRSFRFNSGKRREKKIQNGQNARKWRANERIEWEQITFLSAIQIILFTWLWVHGKWRMIPSNEIGRLRVAIHRNPTANSAASSYSIHKFQFQLRLNETTTSSMNWIEEREIVSFFLCLFFFFFISTHTFVMLCWWIQGKCQMMMNLHILLVVMRPRTYAVLLIKWHYIEFILNKFNGNQMCEENCAMIWHGHRTQAFK